MQKIIDYVIIRNKSWLYEADFTYDGERFVVENHKWFKVASDLVAHALDKWKRRVLGFWGFLQIVFYGLKSIKICFFILLYKLNVE